MVHSTYRAVHAMKPLTELMILGFLSTTTVYAIDATTGAPAGAADQVSTFVSLLDRFGVAVVILLYFIVRDYYRWRDDRDRMAAQNVRIEELEKMIRTSLLTCIQEANDTMKKSNIRISRLIHILKSEYPDSIGALERVEGQD